MGALKEYLTDISTSKTYNKIKDEVWNTLGKLSSFGKSAQEVVSKVEGAIKNGLLKFLHNRERIYGNALTATQGTARAPETGRIFPLGSSLGFTVSGTRVNSSCGNTGT